MGKVISKGSCGSCGSSDGKMLYEDGTQYCFVCKTFDPNGEASPQKISAAPRTPTKGQSMKNATLSHIADRGLSRAACGKFGVKVSFDSKGTVDKHFYPWVDKNAEVIGYKTRTVSDKGFYCPAGAPSDTLLFGQQTCRGKGKYITICEGELDAMSVSQMFELKYDVVSIRNGASSAAKELKGQLEFLEGYDNIVVCFDSDKAGRDAVAEVQDLFSPGKLKIVKTRLKDANAYLMEGAAGVPREFISEWWDARAYAPDGIVNGADLWESLVEYRKTKSIPYPWEGLNRLTRGIREELVTITSGSGMGKSQFVRELEFYLLGATDSNIGVLALEETVERTGMGIMSIAANRTLHLEEETDISALKPYFEKTLGTGRYLLYGNWDSPTVESLLSKIRFMVKANDCKYIVLDHLSIIVSAQENGDERKAIDEVMTRLRRLVAELNIGMFLISHLRRSGGTSHEEGGRISLGELRGSQSIAQLSDMVIGLERDQQAENENLRNTTLVRVLKNRYTGETGPACYLKYSRDTGRMTEVPKPQEDDDNTEGEF
jgi:twinkle protein